MTKKVGIVCPCGYDHYAYLDDDWTEGDPLYCPECGLDFRNLDFDYSIEIDSPDIARVVWEDGVYQVIKLGPRDYDRLLSGFDPVVEQWDDGSGYIVSRVNAIHPVEEV